jgi:hypothetical protein
VATDDDAPLVPTLEPGTALPRAGTSTGRTVWDWVQLVGLLLLAAGVVVLVVFALTVGGR